MCKHETKYCPRCTESFECKVGSIDLCQCSTVQFDSSEIEFMKQNYDDCICVSCMQKVSTEYKNQLYRGKLKSILGNYYKEEC